jgi:hypothetical protein
MHAYLTDNCELMHDCFSESCASVHSCEKNEHAHVHICLGDNCTCDARLFLRQLHNGEKNKHTYVHSCLGEICALETRLRGLKFVNFLCFLWIIRLMKCFCVNAGHRHTPDITMLVHWRECDWVHLCGAMTEQLGMQRHLAARV